MSMCKNAGTINCFALPVAAANVSLAHDKNIELISTNIRHSEKDPETQNLLLLSFYDQTKQTNSMV
jgi:hypothetical protein